jgi:serine/threonine-protein kinase
MVRALVCVSVVAFLAGEARAQVNNEAAAEALFLEGRALMQKADYAAAAGKFAASDKAAPSVGARINLGDCYAALGKTASAWTRYKAAANLARQIGDSNRAAIANKKAGEISGKLTFLIVSVPEPVAGLEVSAAGNAVSAALFGQRIPVDPGTIEITARAPDHEPFTTSIDTGQPGAAVTATVPRLSSVEKPVTGTDPVTDPGPQTTPPGPDPIVDTGPEDPGRSRRYLGLGVGAAGVVGLGVGLVFGASASSKWNGAFDDGLCDEATNVCTPEGQEQTDSARTAATISTIAVAGGVALIGAGVVLYLTAPKRANARSARLAPVVGDREIGVALSGAF